MAKMQALNALPDTAMRAAYNFIKEHCAGIEVTLREFRLILKNTGKMAGEKLKALTDWVKKKPAHYDKIEAEGLELLQEEEAELAEKGLLEKVEEALQKESEGLADDAALGLDDAAAVIEKVELEVSSTYIKSKIKSIKSKTPQELLADGWQDITDPRMAVNTTSREFLDPDTGLRIRFDKGVEGASGFEALDHYHIYNPNCTNKKIDLYLDIDGNPVGRGSNASHIVIGGNE